ncbi:MAG TPA: hypothetical protein PKL62_11670 [Accumulibacter sp.]|uniref:hypothetical protein n=2 Tax=Accumulibacter sp. TaxID=2053492 RepID=UPI002C27DA02|nr:hypothetical protein [Accumulibacter sp.]HNN84802.1 hypothetical protein [Accumulibacter sp.]
MSKKTSEDFSMHTSRGPERRSSDRGRPDGLPDRRCGAERRTMRVNEEALAEIEARLTCIEGVRPQADEAGTGWDKLIIELD